MEAKRSRPPYPSDVSDEEWALVTPYLTLMTPAAPQRQYALREVFTAVRWLVRTGAAWTYPPNDFPSWSAVYQQTQRWFAAGCFDALVADLRVLLRLAQGRAPAPSASIFDSRTVQGTPESGPRVGYDGHRRRRGSKIHLVVDTLGEFLALVVTPVNGQDQAQVGELTSAVQAATGETAEQAANERGTRLVVIRLEEAKRGFVLLPRRWVMERSFA